MNESTFAKGIASRLLIFIGVLTLFAVTVILSTLFDAADQADAKEDQRTTELLRGEIGIASDKVRARGEQLAVSNALFAATRDLESATNRATACTLTASFTNAGFMTLSGEPLLLCTEGKAKDIQTDLALFYAARQSDLDAINDILQNQPRYAEVFTDYVFSDRIIVLTGRPYVVVTALVAPQKSQPLTASYMPVLVFAVVNLSSTLGEIESSLQLSGLELRAEPPQAVAGQALISQAGNPTVTAVWSPSSKFRHLLMQSLPMIFGLVIFFLGSMIFYLRRLATLQLEMAQQERAMRHMALHDSLTGLPNRLSFRNVLDAALKDATSGAPLCVGILDIDRFKQVNDSYGHDVGDLFIQAAAKRATESLGSQATVARLGGDEFAFIIPNRQLGDIESALAGLRQALKKDMILDGKAVGVSASIGAALVTAPTSAEPVLKCADLALYDVKQAGRADFRLRLYSHADRVIT